MTALAGRWNFGGGDGAARDAAAMLASQALYGPHDEALWDLGALALGRRLFRILPEDMHDDQPMKGGDGRFVMVADARLDNREELAAQLGLSPQRARGMADSAFMLAAWERWQEDCFAHLFGDYAFALFDHAQRKLVLARDAQGGRPLHYHRAKDFVAFASMPKGLHALREIPRAPDEERMAEQIVLLPESGPQTFFKDVSRVESGQAVTITPDGITLRQHWQPERKLLRLSGTAEYAQALREQLDRAVKTRLRGAEGKIGAHLSSGFDSSAVATSAALQMGKDGKVLAFTSVPREGWNGRSPRLRLGDEGPIAALTAARYANMEHVLVRPDRSPIADLDRQFFIFERPVLNLCNMVWASGILDTAKARGVRVMLAGQMGNMSISYDGLTLLPELVREGRYLTWLREGAATVRTGHLRIRNLLANSFGPYMPLTMWRAINRVFRGVDPGPTSYCAIRPELLESMDFDARAKASGLDLDYRPRLDGFSSRIWALRRSDLGNYLKGMLGGWGVDQRDPTSDRRLLEFCLAVPEEQFLRNGETKALAREAFAGRLPPEVIAMRGKGYQAADWYEGLLAARGEIGAEIERLSECGPAASALDLPRLKALLDAVPSEGWEKERVMRQYRLAMLRGISAGHFLLRASGSNA